MIEQSVEKLNKFIETQQYHWQRFTKRSLDVTQGQKYGAPSEDRTHYLVIIDLAREAYWPIQHVDVPQ